MLDKDIIKKQLMQVIDSETGINVIEMGIVSSIVLKEGNVGFALEFPDKNQAMEKDYLRSECEKVVKALPGVGKVTIVSTSPKDASGAIRTKISLPNIKHIILVSSGKGGVGKSTVALNIALSLVKLDYRTALVDADIYGPSIPYMLGTQQDKPAMEDNKLLPIVTHGLKTMSIGYLVEDSQAAIWRGPMITKALHNLIVATKWGDIDYLIVDTPPGTGDIHLTLAEKFPVTGVVIVSTPQQLALIDARKALNMFVTLKVTILGMVENMSYFSDPSSQNVTYIFGKKGAEKAAEEMQIPFLGSIPLDTRIGDAAEQHKPLSLAPEIKKIYQNITNKIVSGITT